ncbi:MAG: hypothetical protein IJY31_04880 [Muribaculaceae bacterium]|nr:hypothetical protein [Muribaculaceae bacterium]
MKPLLSVILAVAAVTSSLSAETTYAPRDYSVIPPSPEVASLVKAIDFPIDYFKGIPDISLPIYTVREGALSVPVILQYQGGGIRVDEREGNVGLGWVLHAGGVICRNVYGHPDEMNQSGVKGLFNATEKDRLLREFARNTIADYDPGDINYYRNYRSMQQEYSVAYNEGKADMANDIFKVSCQGINGTFIYNDSREIVLSSPVPVTISSSPVISSYPPEFIVTDAKGTKYYFNGQEQTKYVYYYGSPESLLNDSVYYTSAWHLTKIKNIHNDSIIFKYDSVGQKKRTTGYGETVYEIDNNELDVFIPDNVLSRGQITYYPHRLTSIHSTSITVKFIYGTEKYDQVVRMQITANDEMSEVLRVIEFEYNKYADDSGYKIADDTQVLTGVTDGYGNRYSFSYYDAELPLDFYAQEFCGYYNGKTDNAGLSPVYAVDRGVAPDVAMTGCLKSINYPTGGKTEFIWESHEYGSVGDVEVKSHTTNTVSKIKTDTLVGLLEESGVRKLKITDYKVSGGTFVYLDMTKYFNFNPQILMTTEYEHSHVYDEGTGYLYNYPAVTFKNKDTQAVGYDYVFFLDKNTIETRYGNEPVKVNLSSGSYDIELHYPTDVMYAEEQIEREFRYADADCGRIFLTLSSYTGSTGTTTTNKDYWGGVRISQIKSYADEDSIPIIKQYLYDSEDPAVSSGVVPTLPDYESRYYITCPSLNTLGYENAVVTGIHSHGLYNVPVGNVGVEYSSVTECLQMVDQTSGMPQNTHKIYYRYSTQKSYDKQDYNSTEFRDYQATGTQMWTSLAHRRGNLMQKNYYISTSMTSSESVSYEYNIYEPTELSEFTTDLFRVGDFNPMALSNDYCIGKYSLIPYNKMLKRETLVASGVNETVTEYSYFYDRYSDKIDSQTVRSKTITASNGESKQVFYTYKTTGSGICLDFPETEVTVVGGIITDAKRMEYHDGSNLLKATYRLGCSGESAMWYNLGEKTASVNLLDIISEPEYTYSYDAYGNLVEIRFREEVLASYLWGYRGLYPIVEVKGLPYKSLVSALATIGKHPDHLISSETTGYDYLATLFSALRLALPMYDITTMTYHWILGISSATGSDGSVMYFTYDDWGRLLEETDYNRYFIRKYDYNYQ